MIHPNQTIAELLVLLQTRIEKGRFIDSAHKMKSIITIETAHRIYKGK